MHVHTLADARARIRRLQRESQYLESFFSLQLEGYEAHFAVDFSELYAYAFPLRELFDALKDEVSHEELARRDRQRVAGFALLEVLQRQVLLLPPYLSEMRRMLRYLRGSEISALEDFVLKMQSDAMARARAEESIRRSLEGFEEAPMLRQDDVLELAKEALKELFSVVEALTGRFEDGLARLRALAEREQLVLWSDPLPDVTVDQNMAFGDTVPWARELATKRRGHRTSSLIDAWAAGYVREINKQIVPSRSILFLVSRSEHFQHTVEPGLLLSIPELDEPLSPFWNMDRVLAYVIFCEQDVATSLSRTRDYAKQVDSFLSSLRALEEQIAGALVPPGTAPEDSPAYDASRRALNLVEDKLEGFENLSLASAGPEPWAHRMRQAVAATIDARHAKWGLFLEELSDLFGAPDMRRALAEECGRVFANFGQEAFRLYSLLDLTARDVARDLPPHVFDCPPMRHIRVEDMRVIAVQIGDSLSSLHLHTEETQRIAAGFCQQIGRSPEAAFRYLLVEIATQPLLQPETHLFLAFVHAAVGSFTAAANELKVATDSYLDTAIPPEFEFVQAICLRLKREIGQALHAIDRALQAAPDDPRYLKEKGVILWLEAAKSDDPQSVLKHAYDATQQALDAIENGVDLKLECLRNLAHYSLEMFEVTGEGDHLNRARDETARYERLAGTKPGEWPAGYLYTKGKLLLVEATLTRPRAEQRELCNQAIQLLEQGLATTREYDRLIRLELAKAHTLIAEAPKSSPSARRPNNQQ